MLKIHKYLFINICDKNFDHYSDLINVIKSEIQLVILAISDPTLTDTSILRMYIHKLINNISSLDNNSEIIYLCRQLLNIDKNNTNILDYKECLNMILLYDINQIF